MKTLKILLICLLALSGAANAQMTLQKNGISTYNKYGIFVQDTTAFPGFRAVSGYFEKRDSLVGSGSVIYNFTNGSLFSGFKAYNAGANADTVTFQNYSVLGAKYLNSIGLYDELKGYVVSDMTTIIIDPGEERSFRSFSPYPGRVKIIPKVTTGQAGDKVYILFIGAN